MFKQYRGIKKLNREIFGAMVNKIIIDNSRNITIVFKFQDEIKNISHVLEKGSLAKL